MWIKLEIPKDHVVDINSDSDLDGQDVTDRNTEGRNQYTNTEGQNQWHCGTSRQTFDAIPSRWVLPFAYQYSISSNKIEGSTSKVSIFYKGQIFDTKQKLKNEFGNYALNEKFNPRIRQSTKNRFEAGCNDIKCDFALRPYVGMVAHIGLLRNLHMSTHVLWTHMSHTSGKKPEDSYQLLPAYFHLLKVTNPGTLMAIHTDLNNNFLYSFFALGQCIKGFQTVIRQVIDINATHLKGDGETENSWTWFLERLREEIGEVGGMLFVFDHHASIDKALSIVYPNVPHCICFFHLKQNLKPRLKGQKEVLEVYYKTAYCSTSRQFNLEMDKIKKIHQGTYDTLMSIVVTFPVSWEKRWFNDRREQAGKNPTYLEKEAVGHCKERNEWSLTYNVYPIELTIYLVKDARGKLVDQKKEEYLLPERFIDKKSVLIVVNKVIIGWDAPTQDGDQIMDS
ncbi:hypothetical protein Ddye_024089 [Dipteronia dyeriana]|uniref:MULE transposase domain-containing protein n=1 Tax=Dipteronia dyeriana TaxID=168575 RepID=A0AAD9TUB4_9ROSI|nr:hypothetical protein Ddye_024089 [Dipteronia dyeriana]